MPYANRMEFRASLTSALRARSTGTIVESPVRRERLTLRRGSRLRELLGMTDDGPHASGDPQLTHTDLPFGRRRRLANLRPCHTLLDDYRGAERSPVFSTRETVRILQEFNPRAGVCESWVRSVLRRRPMSTLQMIAGRLLWSREDINELARQLEVELPFPESADQHATSDKLRAKEAAV